MLPGHPSATTMAESSTKKSIADASSSTSPVTRLQEEKKRAMERRRQQVQRQRTLARVQQKLQDIDHKKKFLETELQKNKLKRSRQRSCPAEADDLELRQLQLQIRQLEEQEQQTRLDMDRLQREIQEPTSTKSTSPTKIIATRSQSIPKQQHQSPASRPTQPVAVSTRTSGETTVARAARSRLAQPKTKPQSPQNISRTKTKTPTPTMIQLQRQLARAQQRKLDGEAKREFLQTDLRKHKLKVTRAAVENEQILRQIQQQLTTLQAGLQTVDTEIQRLRVEIQRMTTSTNQQPASTTNRRSSVAESNQRTNGAKATSSAPRSASISLPTTPPNGPSIAPVDAAAVLTDRIRTPAPKSTLMDIDLAERKDLELSRLLAHREHKIKELQSKQDFLETDRRKLELKLEKQRQHKAMAAKFIAENELSLALIQEQKKNLKVETESVEADVRALKTEMTKRQAAQKTPTPQQQQSPTRRNTLSMTPEQARFEAEKRAAAEARRRELTERRQRSWQAEQKLSEEKKRAFLDVERRKQEMSQQVQAQAAKVQQQKDSGLGSWSSVLHQKVDSFASETTGENDNNDNSDSFNDETKSMSRDHFSEEVKEEVTQIETHEKCVDKVEAQMSEEAQTKSPHEEHSNNGISDTSNVPAPSGSNSEDGVTFPHPERQQLVTEEEDLAREADLRQRILLQWALQPPHMQCLRPVDQLLQTIQDVFPPAHNLGEHKHFSKWKPISLDATCSDKEKVLTKAVRKLRFFLHPDRLPGDLTDDQDFVCRLLWDITSDAWEDYQKANEELDWI